MIRNSLNWAIEQTSRKYCVDKKLVELIYQSYWKFIRTTAESIPIKNEEKIDLDDYTTNFNLPYLGKLYIDKNKVNKYYKQKNYRRYVKSKKH